MHAEDGCTCGHHLDFEDEPVQVFGKMMAIAHEDNGPLVRAKIIFADAGDGMDPDDVEFEVLYMTGWHSSPKKADREALYRYWPLYEFRHGFKHPDDPRRTVDDPPPTQNVMSMLPVRDLR